MEIATFSDCTCVDLKSCIEPGMGSLFPRQYENSGTHIDYKKMAIQKIVKLIQFF